MTNCKKLPVTLAVLAALCSGSAFAQETITQEQLDRIVAQAVEKALAERQAKLDAIASKQVDPLTTPDAPKTPDMAIPYGIDFTGYARYGAQFQSGDQKYVAVDGSYNGASALGRLGNEGNGGEFQLSKAFKSDNGAIWDVVVMIDHWGDEVNLKKPMRASPTFLLPSQMPTSGQGVISTSVHSKVSTTISG